METENFQWQSAREKFRTAKFFSWFDRNVLSQINFSKQNYLTMQKISWQATSCCDPNFVFHTQFQSTKYKILHWYFLYRLRSHFLLWVISWCYQQLDYTAMNSTMIDELDGSRFGLSRYYPNHFSGGIEQNHKKKKLRKAGVTPDI